MDEGFNGFDKASSEFLDWFTSQSGTTFHPSLVVKDLRHRGAGRGLIATSDIPPETDLFTIPRNAIISIETSDLAKKLPDLFRYPNVNYNEDGDDDDDQDEKDAQDLPTSWLHLILILLHETLRSPPSSWQPYLSILPSQPSDFTTPIFWNEADLAHLQSSSLVSKIGRAKADSIFRTRILTTVQANAPTFYGISDSSQYLSDEDLATKCHVIASLIMSYAFDLQPDEDDDSSNENNEDGWTEDRNSSSASTMGMIPVADLLNADAEFNAHLSHGSDHLTMTSLRTIHAGEEVLNYYGPLPNSELLRRYGYTSAKHARYDIVDISWDLVKNCIINVTCGMYEAPKDAITTILAKVEADDEYEVSDGFTLERDSGDPNEEGLCTHPANFVSFPEDLVAVLQEVVSQREAISPTHPAKGKDLVNEIKRQVLAILKDIVRERTGEYATKMEEDEEILRQNDIGGRMKMAVEVRLGEKRLLKEAMDWCEEAIAKYSRSQPASDKTERNGDGAVEPPSKKQKRSR